MSENQYFLIFGKPGVFITYFSNWGHEQGKLYPSIETPQGYVVLKLSPILGILASNGIIGKFLCLCKLL
jgi:hypothetical protein